MESTAVVGTASDKDSYKSGGNFQKDEPSDSKKGKLLIFSSGCKETEFSVPDKDWDSTSEDRANDKETSTTDLKDLLEPSFSGSEDASRRSAHSQSSEFEDSLDCESSNETYSVCYSESKLKNESHMHLNSEFKCEMQTREELFFDFLEHHTSQTRDLGRIYRLSDENCQDPAAGLLTWALEEDSQQEYHSAAEQECGSSCLSCQTEPSSLSNLETIGLRNSASEAGCAGHQEDSRVKLGSGSVISLEFFDGYGRGDVSKLQNSVTLGEYHELRHEKPNEAETSLTYHTVFDDFILNSSSPENLESKSGFLNPQKALDAKIYTDKMKSQITESKDFCGNTVAEKNMLQRLENPSALVQAEPFETSLPPWEERRASWTSVFDDSVLAACEDSRYQVLQNTSDSVLDFSVTLPRTAARESQAGEDSSPKASDRNATTKTCSCDMEGTSPKPVTGAASRTVTVHQTVDVSSDFRACFTTNRATSARPAAVSTASNTEITMMNKRRPGVGQSERRSVACNTDCSDGQARADPPMAVVRGPEKSLSADSLTPSGRFPNKDSLEVKTLDVKEFRKHPERELHLSRELEKPCPCQHCQKVLQRAVAAELHLLNVHYQMCRRHCGDIYRLVMENKEGVNRNLLSNPVQKELGLALLSVLGDLKARYMGLKEKIHQGVPLEELPPLSVESKLLSTFSAFAFKLMKGETHVILGADSEPERPSVCDNDSLKRTPSQMSLLPDNYHPEQDVSLKKDGSNGGDVKENFSQLTLEDKDHKNYQELSEDWFDAKENLTGVDISRIQENQIGQDRWDPAFPLEETESTEPLRKDKGYLVHVGGLCPSVSEADLRSLFQKYQISEISIYHSTSYRYASVVFTTSSDAKMAVQEMNGVEIHGQSVNVRLLRTPGEHMSPLSSRSANKPDLNNGDKSTNKEVSSAISVSRLPRTRPRQLGSEPDSEFFSFSQKGVKKNCNEIESTELLPEMPAHFVPPDALNLRSFTKILRRLAELHPEVGRDRLVTALQEVRLGHKGFLSGFSINTIVDMTSSVLKNSASR